MIISDAKLKYFQPRQLKSSLFLIEKVFFITLWGNIFGHNTRIKCRCILTQVSFWLFIFDEQ